ncbi:MAG: fused MFS/spermidine synthase [Sterolibacteriaceae bacterium]|nr:fused MFS/spermidine synthase [Sterolibacteriaceae bacterium]MBK9087066.1 fused MFS/spermidine synthase [Sterolibacteriaceae bacterium]
MNSPPPRHSIEVSEQAGVRYLHFGTEWIQGAMRVARPWSLELDYTREMMAALLLRPGDDWPARALIIGLGAGSIAKFLYRHRPAARLDVVEINPEVVTLARHAFRLPEDDGRLCVHRADGAAFVKTGRTRYDCILVDGFDHRARAGALATEAFYCDCRKRLSRRGLLVANLFGRSRKYDAQFARLATAFAGRAIAFPSGDHGNVIGFAAAGEPISADWSSLRGEADALHRATGLRLQPTIVQLQHAGAFEGPGIAL